MHGHKKEGLEYAMTHGLWGHALFLASKMDERSYSRVMLRFANGLDVNDPLQTLYQLMSGRLPIAVKVNMIFPFSSKYKICQKTRQKIACLGKFYYVQ